jgi:hypothetical protein
MVGRRDAGFTTWSWRAPTSCSMRPVANSPSIASLVPLMQPVTAIPSRSAGKETTKWSQLRVGWAELKDDGSLEGEICLLKGDNIPFQRAPFKVFFNNLLDDHLTFVSNVSGCLTDRSSDLLSYIDGFRRPMSVPSQNAVRGWAEFARNFPGKGLRSKSCDLFVLLRKWLGGLPSPKCIRRRPLQ